MSRTSADVVVERTYVPDREAMLRALMRLLTSTVTNNKAGGTGTSNSATPSARKRRRSVRATGAD